MSEVTQLLTAIEDGDRDAQERLLPLVYEELKQIARYHMSRERANHTLQATDLVHEAYFKLLGPTAGQWDGRAHFFAAAAEAMRRILIDYARRRAAKKHGGGQNHVAWHDELPVIASPIGSLDELLSVNEVLDRLAAEDAELATLVKLQYFAGLSLEETASVLGMSRSTAFRRLRYARAWLREAFQTQSPPD
jgi:RNA polymerase sigma factor (TIGR02999 family)